MDRADIASGTSAAWKRFCGAVQRSWNRKDHEKVYRGIFPNSKTLVKLLIGAGVGALLGVGENEVPSDKRTAVAQALMSGLLLWLPSWVMDKKETITVPASSDPIHNLMPNGLLAKVALAAGVGGIVGAFSSRVKVPQAMLFAAIGTWIISLAMDYTLVSTGPGPTPSPAASV